MPLICVNNVSKSFEDKIIFSDINFCINYSDSLGLVGPSGCGKTTLAKCILGIEKPTQGEIFFKEKNVCKLSAFEKRKIHFIFQNPLGALNPSMTIFENLYEAYRPETKKSKKESYEVIMEALKKVELDKTVAARRPQQLSGGQCQRATIARAILVAPELIIADEPLSSLDVSIKAKIADLFLKIKEELNLSLLFISHDNALVKYLCNNVLQIDFK